MSAELGIVLLVLSLFVPWFSLGKKDGSIYSPPGSLGHDILISSGMYCMLKNTKSLL